MANETLTDVFSDIADAVRAKGVTGQMTPLQMPAKIADIPQSAVAGDPRFEVDANGVLTKKYYNITWFNDLTTINNEQLNNGYQNTNIQIANFPELSNVGDSGMGACFRGCTSLTSVSFPELSNVGASGMSYCFQGCTSLTSVSFPKVQSTVYGISNGAFRNLFDGCTSLTNVSFDMIEVATNNNDFTQTFNGCTQLTSVSFPELNRMRGSYSFSSCFGGCTNLKTVYFPKLSKADGYVATQNMFSGCTSLELVDYHLATAVPKIESNTFNNTNNTFQIVVPDELYDTWIAATNWSARASQIVKYSEYTPAN